MSDGEFSVWGFMPDGHHFAVERFVDGETAMRAALEQTEFRGNVRIIITDGGDHTVFEWKRGEGATWPKQ